MSADWTYKGKKVDSIPEEYEGFVYLITNTKNGKKYIGKKLAKFKTTKPPLKGYHDWTLTQRPSLQISTTAGRV